MLSRPAKCIPKRGPEASIPHLQDETEKAIAVAALQDSAYQYLPVQAVLPSWSEHLSSTRPAPTTEPSVAVNRRKSYSSSTDTLMTEKQLVTTQLPSKRYGRIFRNLRYSVFSVYRRLNVVVVLGNVVAMITLGAQQRLFTSRPESTATAVSTNLALAVVIRQELVINMLFILFSKCPPSFPLRLRRLAAKVYHLGGMHSGAAISATIWFLLLNISITNFCRQSQPSIINGALLSLTIILDILLLSVILLSLPMLRMRMHNFWEMVHRFAGWTAVVLFWIQFGLLAHVQQHAQGGTPTLAILILKSPSFWCLIIITVSLVLPWLRLRKVPVYTEPLSDHAIRLHFNYTSIAFCSAPRISDSPLREWHAFAGIPNESGPGFSILVSKAGDWTTRLIDNPPSSLWVLGVPIRGILHVAPIFNRIILVATGSGIGPVLSLIFAKKLVCRILWSTRDPEQTYQRSVVGLVRAYDPGAIIINTCVSGRPDLVQETYRLYKDFDAEAVFIISNPKVTSQVVYGLESRGIPTFGPIFDS